MSAIQTYAKQRDRLNQTIAAQAPAELLEGFAAAAARLDELDFASRAPAVGDEAPGFVLPDQNGEFVDLFVLLREGPVVVIFYRGEWCPYCNLQLRTFQARLEEIERHGAQLVAISVQTPDHSLSMAERGELQFLVLSDAGAAVTERYGLRYELDAQMRALVASAGNDLSAYNGETGWVLPAVATFVIDTTGHVRYSHVRGNWTERSEPDDVLEVLERLDATA